MCFSPSGQHTVANLLLSRRELTRPAQQSEKESVNCLAQIEVRENWII
jgi:hypothetical protein